MRMRSTWLVPVLTLMMAEPAFAQEKGQVGLTMGYPASVGIVWHAADRVALRPEFTFNRGTTDSLLTVSFGNQTQTTQFSNTTTLVGTGVSGLFRLWKRDALSAFVTPRYTYSHVSATPSATTAAASTETATASHGVSGSFGAQYAMGRRFSVFGDVGVAYSSSVSNPPDLVTGTLSTTGRSEFKSHGVGMRTGVGVVLYFR
jgi:hypothetical protein